MKKYHIKWSRERFITILLAFLVGCSQSNQASQIIPTLTLDPLNSQDFVKNLVITNGGCRLPCWWGIEPGKTTWEAAYSFLEPFATTIKTLQENLYGFTYKDLPKNVSDGGVGATITVKENIVQTIGTDIFFPLPELLQNYGKPDQVWVYADRTSIDPTAPYIIALYYEGNGILATYGGRAEKETPVIICPANISGPATNWYLWNPNLEISFKDAGKQVLLPSLVHYTEKPAFFLLEDVTNIDRNQFFETYQQPISTDICFEME